MASASDHPSAKALVLGGALLAVVLGACSGASAKTLDSPLVGATATPAAVSTTPARTAAATASAQPSVAAPTPTASSAPTATASPAATTAPASTAAPAATSAPATPAPAATSAAATSAAPAPAAGSIVVALVEMKIKVDRASAPAGAVTFAVKNFGTVAHEFLVLKTDIAQDQIPADPARPGRVLEPGLVAKTASLAPGGAATLSLTLASGKYVLICNEPAHYLMGMHIAFTID